MMQEKVGASSPEGPYGSISRGKGGGEGSRNGCRRGSWLRRVGWRELRGVRSSKRTVVECIETAEMTGLVWLLVVMRRCVFVLDVKRKSKKWNAD
mgnify:CR=1 FL=1